MYTKPFSRDIYKNDRIMQNFKQAFHEVFQAPIVEYENEIDNVKKIKMKVKKTNERQKSVHR